MPNPVAANDLQPISGSLQTSRISYGVETAGKNYGQNYNGTTWYSDIPQNGSQYTIISDNYTANYYVSRSNAGGGYVEGGLPAVDEYSAPVFWMTAGTSSLDIITIVNGLPDRIGQTPFSSGSQALNWIASSSNYFAVGPPFEQIDADQMALNLNASQIISYPTTASTWYDISGYNYKATLTNGPTFNPIYKTITFDDTNDYAVFIGTGGDILSPTAYASGSATWEGIVRFNAGTGTDAVITKWDNSTGVNWWFGRYPSNTVHLALLTSAGYQGLLSSTTIPTTTTKFQQIAVTTSGTNYVFYINGVAAGSGTYNGTWSSPYSATPVVVGAQDISTGGAAFFGGDIAEIRLYNKTLSSTEILQNYYGGPVVTGSISGSYYANNLVSYASGSTITYNLSADRISGSLQNGVLYNPTNGGYWSFDGSDDRILLEGSTTNAWTLNADIDWTVNAWIRTTTTANGLGAGSVFSNSSGGPVYSMMGVNAGVITYWHYNGAWLQSSGIITVNDGKWHMLTWVNFAGGVMNFYVDGGIDTAGVDSSLSSGNALDIIGASWAAYYQGDIASLQINKGKAFTAAEVLQQYNATK